MKKNKLFNTLSRSVYSIGYKIKKYSPEIMVVSGVIGLVGATVVACKATTKLDGILDEAKQDIDVIHDSYEHPEKLKEEYTEQDRNKDLAIVYAQTGVKLAKLYGPSILLGVVSITSIFAGNNILRKRNVALAAAYTAVDKGFKEYRGRVVERFGEDLDRELRYNIKAKEIEETVIDENGEEKVETKTVQVINPQYSIYARCYDVGCNGWSKDPALSLEFLRCQQDWANEKLQRQGRLLLNDVYDMLGIPRSKAGCVIGWIYDNNKFKNVYVDFGIYDVTKKMNRYFVEGTERAIWLDFNPVGPIDHYFD